MATQLVLLYLVLLFYKVDSAETNVVGVFGVHKGLHYANKTSVVWGYNSQTEFAVDVALSAACASYNSSTSCDDAAWYIATLTLFTNTHTCVHAHKTQS